MSNYAGDLYDGICNEGSWEQRECFEKLGKHLLRKAEKWIFYYEEGCGLERSKKAEPCAAQDFVQQALVKIWQDKHTVRNKNWFLGWAFQILRNSIGSAYGARKQKERTGGGSAEGRNKSERDRNVREPISVPFSEVVARAGVQYGGEEEDNELLEKVFGLEPRPDEARERFRKVYVYGIVLKDLSHSKCSQKAKDIFEIMIRSDFQLTDGEIADRLGMTAVNVRVVRKRGREELKQDSVYGKRISRFLREEWQF